MAYGDKRPGEHKGAKVPRKEEILISREIKLPPRGQGRRINGGYAYLTKEPPHVSRKEARTKGARR